MTTRQPESQPPASPDRPWPRLLVGLPLAGLVGLLLLAGRPGPWTATVTGPAELPVGRPATLAVTVTDRTGRPLAGVPVTGTLGQQGASAVTDPAGRAEVRLVAPPRPGAASLEVVAGRGPSSDRLRYLVTITDPLVVALYVPRARFEPGTPLPVTILARHASGRPATLPGWRLAVVDAAGRVWYDAPLPNVGWGVAKVAVPVAREVPRGRYQVTLRSGLGQPPADALPVGLGVPGAPGPGGSSTAPPWCRARAQPVQEAAHQTWTVTGGERPSTGAWLWVEGAPDEAALAPPRALAAAVARVLTGEPPPAPQLAAAATTAARRAGLAHRRQRLLRGAAVVLLLAALAVALPARTRSGAGGLLLLAVACTVAGRPAQRPAPRTPEVSAPWPTAPAGAVALSPAAPTTVTATRDALAPWRWDWLAVTPEQVAGWSEPAPAPAWQARLDGPASARVGQAVNLRLVLRPALDPGPSRLAITVDSARLDLDGAPTRRVELRAERELRLPLTVRALRPGATQVVVTTTASPRLALAHDLRLEPAGRWVDEVHDRRLVDALELPLLLPRTVLPFSRHLTVTVYPGAAAVLAEVDDPAATLAPASGAGADQRWRATQRLLASPDAALGALAPTAALGPRPWALERAVNALLARQQPDGGWPAEPPRSRVAMTGRAVADLAGQVTGRAAAARGAAWLAQVALADLSPADLAELTWGLLAAEPGSAATARGVAQLTALATTRGDQTVWPGPPAAGALATAVLLAAQVRPELAAGGLRAVLSRRSPAGTWASGDETRAALAALRQATGLLTAGPGQVTVALGDAAGQVLTVADPAAAPVVSDLTAGLRRGPNRVTLRATGGTRPWVRVHLRYAVPAPNL